jgi:hypothetical protein
MNQHDRIAPLDPDLVRQLSRYITVPDALLRAAPEVDADLIDYVPAGVRATAAKRGVLIRHGVGQVHRIR